MNIVETVNIETCINGIFIKDIYHDQLIEYDYILYLGAYGSMQYYPNFARPYYKIIIENFFEIKGVQGNSVARIILYPHDLDVHLSKYYEIMNTYK